MGQLLLSCDCQNRESIMDNSKYQSILPQNLQASEDEQKCHFQHNNDPNTTKWLQRKKINVSEWPKFKSYWRPWPVEWLRESCADETPLYLDWAGVLLQGCKSGIKMTNRDERLLPTKCDVTGKGGLNMVLCEGFTDFQCATRVLFVFFFCFFILKVKEDLTSVVLVSFFTLQKC